jgi:4-hydroxybenzoate polyprenyltransferase
MRYVILTDILEKSSTGRLLLNDLHFSMLVLAAMLITAGGNIINDYFDLKVDKINKPEKVIVGKSVNRKVAILMHQGMNAIAFALLIWVSYYNSFWQLFLLPVAIMFLLWWYSPVFKKRPLIGNLLVAFCTAAVPVFAAITDLQLLQPTLSGAEWNGMNLYSYAWLWVMAIAGFAFVLTMIREAVKDAQDEPGDRTEHYQTLPIVWGIQRTKRYVLSWIGVFMIMVAFCATRIVSLNDLMWMVACLVFPMLMSLYFVVRANSAKDFGLVSRWIKLVMLGGLVLLLALLV